MFRWRHDPPGTTETVDVTGWLDAPSEMFWSRVLGGIVFPLLLLVAGLICVITQRGVIVGRGWHYLSGPSAISLGLACIGAGLFFHAHCFWGPVYRLPIVSAFGRVIGALVFVITYGYVIWSLLWL